MQGVEVGDAHQRPVPAQRVLKLHGVDPVPLWEGGHAVDAAGEAFVGLGVGTQRRQGVEGGDGLEAVSRVILLQTLHGQDEGATFSRAEGRHVFPDQSSVTMALLVLVLVLRTKCITLITRIICHGSCLKHKQYQVICISLKYFVMIFNASFFYWLYLVGLLHVLGGLNNFVHIFSLFYHFTISVMVLVLRTKYITLITRIICHGACLEDMKGSY